MPILTKYPPPQKIKYKVDIKKDEKGRASKNTSLFLFVLVLLFVLPITSEAILLDQQNILIDNAIIGSEIILPINITNNQNVELVNVSLEGLQFTTMNQVSLILPNQSINTYLKVKPTSLVSSTFYGKVYGFFLLDILRDSKSFEINLTDLSYTPGEIWIKEGDSIVFYNRGTVAHSVISSNFNSVIPVNNTYTYTFNTIKDMEYFDLNTAMGGIIHVINKSSLERVRNPSYDTDISITLTSKLADTNLSARTYDPSLTIEAYKTGESVVEIVNIGNKTAEDIFFEMQWTSFQENHFSLVPNERKLIKFIISPQLQSTPETNRSYNLSLTITSKNANQIRLNVLVSIPHKEILQNETSNYYLGLLNQILEFCKQFPVACAEGPNGTQVIYKEKNYSIDLTYSDFIKLQQDVRSVAASQERTENKLQEGTDILLVQLQALTKKYSNLNTSLSVFYEEKQSEKKWNIFKWVILVVVLFVLLITTSIGFLLYRKNKSLLGQ